jgi:hypothetical protein
MSIACKPTRRSPGNETTNIVGALIGTRRLAVSESDHAFSTFKQASRLHQGGSSSCVMPFLVCLKPKHSCSQIAPRLEARDKPKLTTDRKGLLLAGSEGDVAVATSGAETMQCCSDRWSSYVVNGAGSMDVQKARQKHSFTVVSGDWRWTYSTTLKALHGLHGLDWEVVLCIFMVHPREVGYNSDCAQILDAQKRNGSSNQTHIYEAFFDGRFIRSADISRDGQ